MRRAAGLRLFVSALLAALVALGGGVHAPATQPAPAAVAPSHPPAPNGFRLGTAGRPFAWSTAIGDLNADGHPDFAVADRVGRGADGFEYAIELSIAGGRSESVAFDSDQDALDVTLRDVDHDRDLDVVVTGTVSRSIVAVWLNDGSGQFRRAAADEVTDVWRAAASAFTDSPSAEAAIGEAIAGADGHGLVAGRACGGVHLRRFTLATCGAFRTARASLSALRPRAPPIVS